MVTRRPPIWMPLIVGVPIPTTTIVKTEKCLGQRSRKHRGKEHIHRVDREAEIVGVREHTEEGSTWICEWGFR